MSDSDRVGVLLDLSGNAFLGPILRNTAGIGEARWCVEDANLRKKLPWLTTFTNTGTYLYAVNARDFVNAGGFGLALVAGTTLLVDGLEDLIVVVINVVAVKDIGVEFQGRGLPTPVSK